MRVCIKDKCFKVETAVTEREWEIGLMDREYLVLDSGMLFVFDKPGDYPFWMKDMNFAIDILWINEHNEIIHVLQYIAPETYPTAFTSPEDALYVLELPMGTVAEVDIKLGDTVGYDE